VSKSNPRYVFLSGDGEGLGNAVLHHLLRRDPEIRVIGLSRRALEDVEGYGALGGAERARYIHLRIDLSDKGQRANAIAETLALVRDGGGRLVSLVLVNGTGYFDSELRADPALNDRMEVLNVTGPVDLVKGLATHCEGDAPIFYFSGVLTLPSIRDPLLRGHAAWKKRAVAALQELLGDRLKVMMPGAYRTAMLTKHITRQDALLEWYAVPIADPYARGALPDVVAKYATVAHHRCATTIIRPRLIRLAVTTHTAEEFAETLPGAIRRAARAILADTGQTDAHHNARVAYFRRTKLYGDDFPYDRITSAHLWPVWLSRSYAASLGAARLLH
jgi:NAD(P)-dependent dehydrogenase (short-subunit alcohol dehydrogenase family)